VVDVIVLTIVRVRLSLIGRARDDEIASSAPGEIMTNDTEASSFLREATRTVPRAGQSGAVARLREALQPLVCRCILASGCI